MKVIDFNIEICTELSANNFSPDKLLYSYYQTVDVYCRTFESCSFNLFRWIEFFSKICKEYTYIYEKRFEATDLENSLK